MHDTANACTMESQGKIHHGGEERKLTKFFLWMTWKTMERVKIKSKC